MGPMLAICEEENAMVACFERRRKRCFRCVGGRRSERHVRNVRDPTYVVAGRNLRCQGVNNVKSKRYANFTITNTKRYAELRHRIRVT